MKKRFRKLKSLVGTDFVISVYRKPLDKFSVEGFVVGVSDKLLLLQAVESHCLHLDGYAILRLSDISSYKVNTSFIPHALRLLGRTPVVPHDIDLSSWSELIASGQRKYPLVQIETEKRRPDCLFIGRVARQSRRIIALKTIDTKGRWDNTEKFALKDITQVRFDDGYMNALSHLVAHRA